MIAHGRAGAWAIAGSAVQRLVALVTSFVLAAIIGPESFGLIAIALAWTTLLDVLVAQGLGTALVQREHLEQEDLDTAATLTLILGILLGGTAALAAPIVAAHAELPALLPVMLLLASAVPVRAAGIVPQAMLQRTMNFRALAIASASGTIAGAIVAVAMALAGEPVLGLVSLTVISTLVTSWMTIRRAACRCRLSLDRARAGRLLRFSGGMLVMQLGNALASQGDAVVTGLFFGPAAVGLYRLAARIMNTVLEITSRAVQSIALPAFAHCRRDPALLRARVTSSVRFAASLTMPAMVALAVAAEPLLSTLGDRWTPAAGALRLLALLGFIKSMTLFSGPLLLAQARLATSTLLAMGIGLATIIAMLITGWLYRDAPVAEQLLTLAAVRTGVHAIWLIAETAVVTRLCAGLSARTLFSTAAAPITVSLAGGMLIGVIDRWALSLHVPPGARLALCAAIGCAATLIALYLTSPGRHDARRGGAAPAGVAP